jgi:hypothetical protein
MFETEETPVRCFKKVVYSTFGGVNQYGNKKMMELVAQKLNRDLRTSDHHRFEAVWVPGGGEGWEIILSSTDGSLVKEELCEAARMYARGAVAIYLEIKNMW